MVGLTLRIRFVNGHQIDFNHVRLLNTDGEDFSFRYASDDGHDYEIAIMKANVLFVEKRYDSI